MPMKSDLPHAATLPPHVLGQLLALHRRCVRCRAMVRRHGIDSRRGRAWYRRGLRLDDLYCRLWHRHPAPREVRGPSPADVEAARVSQERGDAIPVINVVMETTYMPNSGMGRYLIVPRPRWHRVMSRRERWARERRPVPVHTAGEVTREPVSVQPTHAALVGHPEHRGISFLLTPESP